MTVIVKAMESQRWIRGYDAGSGRAALAPPVSARAQGGARGAAASAGRPGARVGRGTRQSGEGSGGELAGALPGPALLQRGRRDPLLLGRWVGRDRKLI